MSDDLGDRMKFYEGQETGRKFLPLLPVYARIDGRSFSNLTRNMRRPYDERMTNAMIETTKVLVDQTHARIGYVQSDEISLVWLAETYDSSIFFDGKIQKMCSTLASMAAVEFMWAVLNSPDDDFRQYAAKRPHFDARVFQLPNKMEAANAFLWRNLDATKNAVSQAARSFCSHKELDGKSGPEMQEMMFQKGQNFNDYPAFFKRGTWVRRVLVERAFTPEELANIPEKHRPTPDTLVKRSVMKAFDLPKFNSVLNRVAVIFDGADPVEITNGEINDEYRA